MTDKHCARPYLFVELQWLIDDPTSSATAAVTAYDESDGLEGLFSIILYFESPDPVSQKWRFAKVSALVGEMDARLASIEERLVITAGAKPVAIAIVQSRGVEKT